MLIYGQPADVEHLLPPPEQPMAPPAPPAPKPWSGVRRSRRPTPAPATAAPGSGPLPLTNRSSRPAAAGKSAADALEPAEAVSQPGEAGGVRLQLGAVRSEGARGNGTASSATIPICSASLTAMAIRADLGDKGVYYRIQTAPVADTATAERICGELRQRHCRASSSDELPPASDIPH